MSGDFATYPSLRDRVVFVTGGASGIGAEEVTQFTAQGAKVAFVDIADDAAAALIDALKSAGHQAPFYQHCDLKDIAALQSAIAEVGRRLGPITVLVNNAANDQRHKFEDVTVEYWDERLATNLRHQFFAIQAVAPMMRAAGGGSIINFGSVSWHTAQGGMPATLDMAGVILTAAGLGFLGLGAQPPTPEWGAMISVGRENILDQWWVPAVPGMAIFIVSLGFNLLGDGLRDVLDPKMT